MQAARQAGWVIGNDAVGDVTASIDDLDESTIDRFGGVRSAGIVSLDKLMCGLEVVQQPLLFELRVLL